MLYWSLVFLVVALVAALFGFTGIYAAAAGIALGFDRLVLLATGAPHIEQVMWTPVAEP